MLKRSYDPMPNPLRITAGIAGLIAAVWLIIRAATGYDEFENKTHPLVVIACGVAVLLISLYFLFRAARVRAHERSIAELKMDGEPAEVYYDRFWYASLIADRDVPRPGEGVSTKEWEGWLLRNADYAKELTRDRSLEELREMCSVRGIQIPEPK